MTTTTALAMTMSSNDGKSNNYNDTGENDYDDDDDSGESGKGGGGGDDDIIRQWQGRRRQQQSTDSSDGKGNSMDTVPVRLGSEKANAADWSHDEQQMLVRKGARQVVVLKIAVVVLLGLAALLAPVLTYLLIRRQEEDGFCAQFLDFSAKITDQLLDGTQLKFWTCYSLGVSFFLHHRLRGFSDVAQRNDAVLSDKDISM